MKPALLWMEHVLGFERFWEVEFHTNDVAARATRHGSGLRSVVMWDPRVGREVRQQRALAPVLQGLADQHLRRGAPRRRRAAPGARGDGHRRRRARPARSAASSSCPRRAPTTTCCRSGCSTLGIGAIDEDIARAARARDPRRRRPRARVPAADLPQGGGRPLPRSRGRARSSSRSSSARATRASAPATSARCSSASSTSRRRTSSSARWSGCRRCASRRRSPAGWPRSRGSRRRLFPARAEDD